MDTLIGYHCSVLEFVVVVDVTSVVVVIARSLNSILFWFFWDYYFFDIILDRWYVESRETLVYIMIAGV